MKNEANIIFLIVVLTFALAMVSAIKPSDNGTLVEGQKNMTYGRCVSALTEVKSDCYAQTKLVRNNCTASAGDDSTKVKQCSADYKKGKTDCKADFKKSKVDCTQYKKTFTDKLRFWR